MVVGKDYKEPEYKYGNEWESKKHLSDEFSIDGNGPGLKEWWKNFEDPLLNELVEEALENNNDIEAASEAINEARATRASDASSLFPQVSTGASFQKQGLSNKTSSNSNTSGEKERHIYNAGLDATWEIDFFGKIRRRVEAAEANVDIAKEVKHGITLSVTAELASSYFEVRKLQKQIDFTNRNIELLKEIEKLAEAQLRSGVVTELDLNRARSEREEMESMIPSLEAEMISGIYRISVLTGNPPEAQMAKLEEYTPAPLPPDFVPLGLRGDILRRRPDIRRAERELAASTAYIGVAEGALYPSFTLGGDIGSTSAKMSDLFTSGATTYGLSSIIDWDLLKGGQLTANIFAAESQAKQAQINYEQTILLALEDVESSLLRYGKEWQTLKKLKSSETTREESFKIAKSRYENGIDNFQVVLDAERTLIETRDQIIESETRILTYLTQLYKALGGGWNPDL